LLILILEHHGVATSTALPDGSYTITAIDQYAGVTSSPVAITPDPLVVQAAQAAVQPLPLVANTAGPVISALTFDRADATLTVTYQDSSSGMDMASVEDKAFYHLSARPLAKTAHLLSGNRPTSIRIVPGATPTSPVVATVVFEHGARLRLGDYTLLIDSGTRNTGIEDNAHKALLGSVSGTFPSGTSRTHGDFVALVATSHDLVEPLVASSASNSTRHNL
jgi:hypothetical protein